MSPVLPERILVVRLGAIGDVVNALVFAAAVKQAAPGTHIGWVVHPLSRPLVEGHPYVDRVHVWQRSGGWRELRRLVSELRSSRYELAVDLQRIAKSAVLARLSGAGRVLGYDRRRAKELSWLLSKERIAAGPRRAHMVEHYLEFARHLGCPAANPERVLPRDAAAEAWADEQVERLGGAPIVLHIGASKPENRWPAERYGELAAALHSRAAGPLCLTGGPGDRADADRAGARAGHELLDLVGRTSLPQLWELLRRARLYVGCDTGPMHLAAAVDTPVLALFGPADPLRTGPFGAAHRVLRDPGAGLDRETPLVPATMSSLTVGIVVEAVLAHLQEPATDP